MKAALPLVACAAAAALSGCGDVGMDRQAKYNPQAPAPLFPNGSSQQAAPEGAVPQTEPALAAETAAPPPASVAVLARGREEYGVFCQPCHGASGGGDGTVVQRGFPRPQPFTATRQLGLPADRLFDVISNGWGVMYPYRERIEPADRWAIVAYVRALQVAETRRQAAGGAP